MSVVWVLWSINRLPMPPRSNTPDGAARLSLAFHFSSPLAHYPPFSTDTSRKRRKKKQKLKKIKRIKQRNTLFRMPSRRSPDSVGCLIEFACPRLEMRVSLSSRWLHGFPIAPSSAVQRHPCSRRCACARARSRSLTILIGSKLCRWRKNMKYWDDDREREWPLGGREAERDPGDDAPAARRRSILERPPQPLPRASCPCTVRVHLWILISLALVSLSAWIANRPQCYPGTTGAWL